MSHVPTQISALVDEFRRRHEADGSFLTGLVQKYFVDNTHRLTYTMQPDAQHQSKMEAAEAEKLATMVSALSPSDRENLLATG